MTTFPNQDASARAGGLIEGAVGPFYVAINRPTLHLLTALFAIIAAVAVFLLRDAATPVKLFVSFGLAMESGTLVHIYLERLAHIPKLQSIAAHAATLVVLFPLFLLGTGVI